MDVFQAKKEHRSLYATDFQSGTVVWRPLSQREYRAYRDLAWQSPEMVPEIEEQIFEDCVLDSSIPDSTDLGGIVTTVAYQVISVSGVINPMQALGQLATWRAEINTLDEQMVLLVCKAFRYTPEEVEKLDFQEFLRRVAMAEVMLGALIQVETEEAPVEQGVDFDKDSKELNKFRQREGDGSALEDRKSAALDLRKKFHAQRGA